MNFAICLAVLSAIIVGILSLKRYNFNKKWNGSICPKCSCRWLYLKTREDGTRVFKCENNHHIEMNQRQWENRR